MIDSKRDGVIDFEEFVPFIVLFRIGNNEEKCRVLFNMYEPNKNGQILKDNLRSLLVDSTIAVQKNIIAGPSLEEWIADQKELSVTMTELVLMQFASQEGKLDFNEFVNFVKVELVTLHSDSFMFLIHFIFLG